MSTDQSVDTLLRELRPVYDECRQRRTEWNNLQLLPRAKKEYDLALEKESQDLARLEQREKNLREERRRLEPQPAPPPASSTPWNRPVAPFVPGVGGALLGSTNRPAAPPPPPQPSGMSIASRRLLQKRVIRYAHRWNLDPATVEEINSIADDLNRPLGEALSLLDWSLYSNPLVGSETTEAHQARLQEWGTELAIYRDRLQTEIDIERATHIGALDIWERWLKKRDEGDSGLEAWDVFIEDSRQALRDKQAKTRESIASLQGWIAEHHSPPGTGG